MLNMLYESHLSGSERELEIMMAEHELTMLRLNTLLEAVDSTLSVNHAAAELKVLTESGTYSDLAILYEEANADASKAKASIFQKIATAISNLMNRIRDFIDTKILKKAKEVPQEELEEMVEVPKGIAGFVQKLKELVDGIKGNISNLLAGATGTFVTIDSVMHGKLSEIASSKIFDVAGGVVKVARSTIVGWIETIKQNIIPTLASVGGLGAAAAGAAAALGGSKKDNNANSNNNSNNGEAKPENGNEAKSENGNGNENDKNPAGETLNFADKLSKLAQKAISFLSKFIPWLKEDNKESNDKDASKENNGEQTEQKDNSNLKGKEVPAGNTDGKVEVKEKTPPPPPKGTEVQSGNTNNKVTVGGNSSEEQEQQPEETEEQKPEETEAQQPEEQPEETEEQPVPKKKKNKNKNPPSAKKVKRRKKAAKKVTESVEDLLDMFGLSEDDLDMYAEDFEDDYEDDDEYYSEDADDILDDLLESIEDL